MTLTYVPDSTQYKSELSEDEMLPGGLALLKYFVGKQKSFSALFKASILQKGLFLCTFDFKMGLQKGDISFLFRSPHSYSLPAHVSFLEL